MRKRIKPLHEIREVWDDSYEDQMNDKLNQNKNYQFLRKHIHAQENRGVFLDDRIIMYNTIVVELDSFLRQFDAMQS